MIQLVMEAIRPAAVLAHSVPAAKVSVLMEHDVLALILCVKGREANVSEIMLAARTAQYAMSRLKILIAASIIVAPLVIYAIQGRINA